MWEDNYKRRHIFSVWTIETLVLTLLYFTIWSNGDVDGQRMYAGRGSNHRVKAGHED